MRFTAGSVNSQKGRIADNEIRLGQFSLRTPIAIRNAVLPLIDREYLLRPWKNSSAYRGLFPDFEFFNDHRHLDQRLARARVVLIQFK